jgi:hypothetical protein
VLRPPVSAVLPVLTCLVALAACSGDDSGSGGSDDADADRAAVDRGLAELYAGDHPTEDDTAAGTCFAEHLAEVSTDTLRDAGVVDESGAVVADLPQLDEDLATTWVDAQLACTDFVEASTRAQEKVTKGAIDDRAYAACLGDALSDDQVHEALVATVSGSFDDPAVDRLANAQDTCAAQASDQPS